MKNNILTISEKWTASLKHDSKILGIDLTSAMLAQFVLYVENLLLWNKTYNLTSITNLEDIRILHILDSLTIAPFIQEKSVLDIGTGAGFPGLPLALVLPHITFTLLDSNNKKTRFLRHIVRELQLKNVNIQHTRVENFQTQETFANIVTRATSDPINIINLAKHLCNPLHGKWLFMRGKYVENEIIQLRQYLTNVNLDTNANTNYNWHSVTNYKLDIPQQIIERNLIVVD